MTVDRKACVLYRHRDGVTELAVSDPTRANSGAITLTLDVPLGRVLEVQGPMRAEVAGGGTTITLDLRRTGPAERGRTHRIKLAD